MNESDTPQRNRRPRLVSIWLILFFFAGLAFSTFLKIQNNDIFWHLSVGREILEQGRISFPNPFNCTSDGRLYENIEWLFEIVAYPLAALDPEGFVFLILLRMTVFLAIYGIALRMILRSGISPEMAGWLLTVSFLIINCRFFVRTFIISYLMIAIYTHLLYMDSRSPAPNKRLILWLPLLMAIWTNCHPISIMGIAMIGLAGIAELPNVIAEKRLTRRFSILFIAGLATLAAQFVHPHPGKNIARIFYALKEYPHLVVVSEEVRPPLAAHPAFYLTVALGILLLPLAFKKRHWFGALLFLLFGFMALRNVRFLGEFAIASFPYFIGLVPGRLDALAKKRMAAALLFAFMALSFVRFHLFGPAWGAGVDCRKHPCAAVSFLLEHAPGKPLYNNLAYGGFIIWNGYPTLKPFWDGRFEAQKHLFWGVPREGFSRFLIDNGIHLALIPRRTEQNNDQLLNIEKQLVDDPAHWTPIFFGSETLILAHPSEQTAHLIDRFALRRVHPMRSDFGLPQKADPDTLQAFYDEAVRAEKVNPGDPFILWIQSVLLRKLGDPVRAEEVVDKCIEADPRSPGCLSSLGLIEIQTDRPASAVRHLKRSIRYGLEDASTFNNLGTAYLRLGNARKAEKALLEALQIDPTNALAHFNLSLAYEALGNKEKSEHHKNRSMVK